MKYLLKSVAIFFVVVLLSSCNTLKQPKEVFVPIDYTEQDAINAEIQRINELKKDFPVMALWRSELLKDEQTIKENQENVFLLLQQAIEKKDFFSAVKYYVSLESVKYKNLDKINYTKNELYKNYLMDVPGLVVDKKLLPKTVADCINATVTIWVDKGIRIENGAGYADRVIGSGFFIDKRGYIVTNHHVISDLVDPKHESYTRLYIKLARDSETRIPAKVVGYDSLLDLALIKAEVEPPFILELGSSSDLQIGDKVSAIGTPLGLHGTITSGIVSAVSCNAKIPLLPAIIPMVEGNANFISKSILGAYLSFFFLDFCFSSTEIDSSVFISSSFCSSSVEVVSAANKCVEKINKRNKIKYFFIIIPYGINFCIK